MRKQLIFMLAFVLMILANFIYSYSNINKIYELSFENSNKIAHENNKGFKIAKLYLEIAEASLQKSVAGYVSVISIVGNYNSVYKLMVVETPSDYFGPSLIVFPLGMQNYYIARVSFQPPVFIFGKVTLGFLIAKESYEIAKIKHKKAEKKLKLEVISAFYGDLISGEMLKVHHEILKANEEYLRIAKIKYANGQVSKLEILQDQMQYLNSRSDFLKSESLYKFSLMNLKNTLGNAWDSEAILKGESIYKKGQINYEDIKRRLTEKNDDIRILASMEMIGNLQEKFQIEMPPPSMALNANYNYYYSKHKDFYVEKDCWNSSA